MTTVSSEEVTHEATKTAKRSMRNKTGRINRSCSLTNLVTYLYGTNILQSNTSLDSVVSNEHQL